MEQHRPPIIEDNLTEKDVLEYNNNNASHASDDQPKSVGQVVGAKNATDMEHSIFLWEGVRRYKKAIFWSWAFSMCIVMDGYDLAFTGSLYAHPAFQKQFGTPYKDGYEIPAAWQSALTSTLKVG